MPDWFYPLMLVVILAGYVFLFIQGRLVRSAQDAIGERFDSLERALRELISKPAPAAPAPLVVQAPAEERAPLAVPSAAEIRAELEPAFAEVLGHLERQDGTLDGIRDAIFAAEATVRDVTDRAVRDAADQAGRAATAQMPAAADLSPEEVARRFLLEEGFSRIHVTGSDVRENGTRFLVRAMRGDEVRAGHVTINGGDVVDASLKAPSALFP